MEVINLENQFQNFCPTHSKFKLQFSSHKKLVQKEGGEKALFCSVCLIQQDIKTSQLLSIEEAIHQSDDLPITNWPFGVLESQIKYLTRKDSIEKKEQIQEQLEQFYQELEASILQSLRSSKKKQLVLLEECTALQGDVIDFYNDKFKRKELVNLFSHTKIEENEYLQFLKRIDESKEKDLEELSNRIQVIQSAQSQFSPNSKTKQMKWIIEDIISQIEFFSPKNSANLVIADQKEDQQQPQQQESEMAGLKQEDNVVVKAILENTLKQMNSKKINQFEQQYLQLKSYIEHSLQSIMQKNGTENITEESQKLLYFVETLQQNLLSIEIMDKNSKNSHQEEEEEEKEQKEISEKNMGKLLAANAVSMYNELTQTQKELLQSYFKSQNCFYKSHNYLVNIVNEFKNSPPKVWTWGIGQTQNAQNAASIFNIADKSDNKVQTHKVVNKETIRKASQIIDDQKRSNSSDVNSPEYQIVYAQQAVSDEPLFGQKKENSLQSKENPFSCKDNNLFENKENPFQCKDDIFEKKNSLFEQKSEVKDNLFQLKQNPFECKDTLFEYEQNPFQCKESPFSQLDRKPAAGESQSRKRGRSQSRGRVDSKNLERQNQEGEQSIFDPIAESVSSRGLLFGGLPNENKDDNNDPDEDSESVDSAEERFWKRQEGPEKTRIS